MALRGRDVPVLFDEQGLHLAFDIGASASGSRMSREGTPTAPQPIGLANRTIPSSTVAMVTKAYLRAPEAVRAATTDWAQ